MQLHEVDFEYIYDWNSDSEVEKARKIKAREERTAFLTSIGVTLKPGTEDHPTGILLNDSQLVQAMSRKLELKVKNTREFASEADGALVKFNTLAAKLLALPAMERSFNEKCHVHMPGQALATYNEVMLLADACSDNLQNTLDAGWRIIASCPQPDQRRPDYILGRFNPARDIGELGNGAVRR